MKKSILSVLLLGMTIALFGQDNIQGTTHDFNDQVLMTINGEDVMLSEFLYIYKKNNQETSIEKKTMEEYLDLFIKLQVESDRSHCSRRGYHRGIQERARRLPCTSDS